MTYVIYLTAMTLTTELTGQVMMATLTVYNTSERHTELKRKMFSMHVRWGRPRSASYLGHNIV